MTKAERKAMSQKGYTAVAEQPLSNLAIKPNESEEGNQMADETRKPVLSTLKGKTRGKNTREIEYQAFDKEKPETLPLTPKEFMDVTGIKAEAELADLLIDGYNLQQYSAASDEIGEFVQDYWDKTFTDQFRLMIRNGSKLMSKTIEETVNLYKPAIEAGWLVRKAQIEADKIKAAAEKLAADEAAKVKA